METAEIESLIKSSISKGMNYQEYRQEVSQLAAEGRTSGFEPPESYINYTMLNDRRMKRWDKTIKIADDIANRISNFKVDMTWLVITESWCGDAAHLIPIFNKIAELNEGIELRMVYRDENPDLMNAFLTNGNRAIAKLIMVDNKSGKVLSSYGPRPSTATRMVEDYKKLYGTLTPEFKEDLQKWYNKDKGATTVLDLLEILELTSKTISLENNR